MTGYIQRIARERGAIRIFEDEKRGKRRVGRPKMRLVDVVGSDLRTMGVKRWKTIHSKGQR
jgi:hypothetical protein